MQLTNITKITGRIELVTGLHIGSGNTEMHIGGTDNPVIKNPISDEPYIPGSSLKGKMRSLLEWYAGVVSVTNGKPLGFSTWKALKNDKQRELGKAILKLFGGAPEGEADRDLVEEIGPSRLAFWDCSLTREWVKDTKDSRSLLLTETKMENTIDRIQGVAENPRNTERVPAGAMFEFQLTVRVHDNEDLLDTILRGMKLLELTGLGGSGSRGYGKIKFKDLTYGEKPIQEDLDKIRSFEVAA